MEEQKVYGVIIVFVGNYVQGVVFFFVWLGVKVLIVMLIVIVDIKVDVVCGFGGEVLFYGVNFDEVKVKVIELLQQQGFIWVLLFDYLMVIVG